MKTRKVETPFKSKITRCENFTFNLLVDNEGMKLWMPRLPCIPWIGGDEPIVSITFKTIMGIYMEFYLDKDINENRTKRT